MYGSTTGENLFLSVYGIMKELNLPWSKLKSVTTDGAASTTGKETDLIGRI
jgi:hypothetical protein